MKLDGLPIQAQFSHAGYESMYKGLERAVDLNLDHFPKKLRAQMLRLLGDAPPSPFLELVRKAVAGDKEAALSLQAFGPWRTYREAFTNRLSPKEAQLVNYFVHIETESAPVERLLQAKRCTEAAQALARHPLLSRFTSTPALEAVAAAQAPESFVWFQVPGAISVLVSQVALLERLLQESGQESTSLAHLLTAYRNSISPGRQFVHWFKSWFGACSIKDLLDLQIGMDTPLDESTWKRWHSGAVFPTTESLRPFVDHILREKSEEDKEFVTSAIGAQLWAARRLQHAVGILLALHQTDAEKTAMLLGRPSSLADWLTETYGQWQQHWARADGNDDYFRLFGAAL